MKRRNLVAVCLVRDVAAMTEVTHCDHRFGAAGSTARCAVRLKTETAVVDRVGPSWLRRTRRRDPYG